MRELRKIIERLRGEKAALTTLNGHNPKVINAIVALGTLIDDLTELANRPQPTRTLQLVWPSDYKVYTQKFGLRPEYYSKFGLPGHEGVDIRAPSGSNIYACADGVVTLVGWRKAGHAYGYSVRIRHNRDDGEYETIYAHLTEGSAKVKVGDVVYADQLIGLADSTGNSQAAHLHLSLKKIGAKNGGYRELINPEPYFIDGPK
jgi:murein DD-endopeptidase MepM/ murein hydrolase activator NlpD